MAGHELLTLQFGHYANFVGTHFWNLQEQQFSYQASEAQSKDGINHDVLFREGLNDAGQTTFTPRLIAYDKQGSLRALSKVR